MLPVTLCRLCGAAIFWAVTPAGKRMPLDVAPSADGNVVLVNGVAHVNVPGNPRYVPHFATCTKYRRK